MLRDTADSLFHYLIEAFPPDRPYSRLALEHEAMPRLVAHYLTESLSSRVEHEVSRLAQPRSAWLAVEHPEVQHALQALRAALLQQARIPAEEWSHLLQQAVRQVLAYLVRPVRTLVHFTFRDEERALPVDVIQERMQYFAAYPYLRQVVTTYIEQKRLSEIDRARFGSLLTHSDRQMTEDYDAAAWLRLLTPLFGLMRTMGRSVPVELLIQFFGEKEANEAQERLRRAREQQGIRQMDSEALRRLLEERPAPPPPRPEPAPPGRPAHTPPPYAPPAAVPPAAPAQPAAGSNEAVPLWKRFQQGSPPASGAGAAPLGPGRRPEAPAPPRAQPPAARPPAPAPPPQPPAKPPAKPPAQPPTPSGRSVPLWMQFRQPKESAAPTASDLDALERTVLGANGRTQRDLFVEKLFSGSTDEYQRVLRLLQDVSSWSHASQIIAQEVFRKHQVNIYSDPAIAFTDAVETQLRHR